MLERSLCALSKLFMRSGLTFPSKTSNQCSRGVEGFDPQHSNLQRIQQVVACIVVTSPLKTNSQQIIHCLSFTVLGVAFLVLCVIFGSSQSCSVGFRKKRGLLPPYQGFRCLLSPAGSAAPALRGLGGRGRAAALLLAEGSPAVDVCELLLCELHALLAGLRVRSELQARAGGGRRGALWGWFPFFWEPHLVFKCKPKENQR